MSDSKKIAVFFPGIGYGCHKPLLYYTKRIAVEMGYEVRDVPYTGFAKDIKGDKEKLVEAFKSALSQTEMLLLDVNWGKMEDILFVSKSIGTIVAAVYARKKRIRTRNIYFTPLEETMEFGIDSGLVFHGTADSWAGTEIIKAGCEKEGIRLRLVENTNHSLETGEIFTDIETMSGIMWQVHEYIGTQDRQGAEQAELSSDGSQAADSGVSTDPGYAALGDAGGAQ